jgi:hypothetical protein
MLESLNSIARIQTRAVALGERNSHHKGGHYKNPKTANHLRETQAID